MNITEEEAYNILQGDDSNSNLISASSIEVLELFHGRMYCFRILKHITNGKFYKLCFSWYPSFRFMDELYRFKNCKNGKVKLIEVKPSSKPPITYEEVK